MDKSKESRIGEVIDGRYVILDQLGEGAAGTVFRAEDYGRHHAFVALKILHAKDPRWEGFFRREFELLSGFRHPNIVSVYDFGHLPEEGSYYFTQELIVGRPLLESVSGQAVVDVLKIFLELCRALEFIHGHQVLHRDLKPANILVSDTTAGHGRVKLLDFGLWREFETKPVRGARWAGTPPYLATEVLRGFGHSVEADIYAVGVTLYQALTRRLPHGRGTPQELIERRRQTEVVYPDHINDKLRALVSRMMHEDKALRPHSASEVAAYLEELIDESRREPVVLGHTAPVSIDPFVTAFEKEFDAVMASSDYGPRWIHIDGQAGTGKSRLAEIIKTKAQLRGARVGMASSGPRFWAEYHAAFELTKTIIPHWFYRKQIQDVPDVYGADVYGAYGPGQNDLPETELEPEKLTGVFSLDSGAVSHNIDEILQRFLAASKKRMVVAILDDIDDTDEMSLLFLSRILRRAAGLNFILVTTGPGTDMPAALQGAVPDQVFTLSNLKPSETKRFCRRLLSIDDIPEGWLSQLDELADGNQTQTKALLRHWIETGVLKRTLNGWAFQEAPPELSGLSEERLRDRYPELPMPAQQLLSSLALLNQPVHVSLLAGAMGLDVESVLNYASKLEQGFWLYLDDGVVRLASARAQRVVCEYLESAPDRVRMILRLAQVLSHRQHAGSLDGASAISELFRQAGMHDKSLLWALKALKDCIRIVDIRTAEHIIYGIQQDLKRLQRDSVLFVRGMIRLGEYYSIIGRVELAFDHLYTATQSARQALNDLAPGLIEHCWDRLMTLGKTVGRLQAVTVAYRQWILSRNMTDRHFTNPNLFMESDPLRAVEIAQTERFSGSRLSYLEKIYAQQMQAQAMFYAGKTQAAYQLIRSVRKQVSARNELLLGELLRFEAQMASILGKRLIARKRLEEAMQIADRSRTEIDTVLCQTVLVRELMHTGVTDQALKLAQQIVTSTARNGRRYERVETLTLIGEILHRQGEYIQARRHLLYACQGADRLRDSYLKIQVRLALLENALTLDRAGEAQVRLHEVDDLLKRNAMLRVMPRYGRALARLSMISGDLQNARISYMRALQVSRYMSLIYEQGLAWEGIAHVHLRLHQMGAAHLASQRALNIFRRYDAILDVQRVEPLVRASSTR